MAQGAVENKKLVHQAVEIIPRIIGPSVEGHLSIIHMTIEIDFIFGLAIEVDSGLTIVHHACDVIPLVSL